VHFILGVYVFHEAMTTGRWIGFALVWTALVVFSIDMYRHTRKNSKASALLKSEQAEIEASGA
jgi:chloramphenicol-sensitive protein RarD